MINELLWVGLMLISFFMIILAYKLFGKYGLYAWTAMAVILANIQVMKTVEVFGLVTALGTVIYSSLFLVTDILNENHGKKDAERSVWIGFFILVSTTIIMQITLFFVPHESDFLSPHIKAIFSLLPRIAFASIIAYLASQFHDVFLFARLKKVWKGKKLWLRNNLSTMASQTIDNILFTFIAFGPIPFLGQVFEWNIIFQIFIVALIMKYVVALLDTPFIYLVRYFYSK